MLPEPSYAPHPRSPSDHLLHKQLTRPESLQRANFGNLSEPGPIMLYWSITDLTTAAPLTPRVLGQFRSHMRILSVISIKTYERYGYNYLREIVLRRADYNEYKILEKDFKSLHPNDFEDLNILHIQGKLDHLPKQDKVNLHNAVSLWTRNIVIRKRVEDLQLALELS
ncbi:hypothetical protein Tco_0000654 [Tanacetum coccineum]